MRTGDLWIADKQVPNLGYAVRFNNSKGIRLGYLYFGMGDWWGWCDVEHKERTSGHFDRVSAAEDLREHYLIEHYP
jgi:hypothetical protein